MILGVSPNTVRRRVVAGSLRSERIPRPQGEMIRVYLDHVPGEVPEQVPPDVVPEDAPNEVPPTFQTPVPDTARVEAMVSLIQTTIATVLGPLVAEQTALRQTVERQAGEIAELREDRGRLTAENAALRASHSPVAPDLTRSPGTLTA